MPSGKRSFRLTRRVQEELQLAGAVLIRDKKHLVYRLANGRQAVLPFSPSDAGNERVMLAQIRRAARA